MLELVKPFNFIIACDSYKLDHVFEMPEDVTHALSVIVPRKKSKYSDLIVAMGMTFCAHILSTVRIEQWMVDEAEIEANEQGYTFNRAGWETIVTDLNGVLPLALYGVEEGTQVQPQTPIVGIVNTDPRFAWLPADVETWTHAVVWKQCTVASTCLAARKIIKDAMIASGSDLSMLNYKLHNFGDRGADSPEEAPVIAGMAHAALFNGSDCTRANSYIKAMFVDKTPMTTSVEATEHSVTCMNSDATTKDDFGMATKAIERLYAVVERTKNGIGIPLLSVVIDTYDDVRFVRDYMGTIYKKKIINSGGKMVMRPDSGDPLKKPAEIAGYLEDTFGVVSRTSTGHKVLHPAVGLIQGDGLNIFTLKSVVTAFIDAGYSMDNLALGMGGGTTHEGGRDDFGFSMKTVACSVDGGKTWRRLLKEPKSDPGKKSLSGLVRPMYVDDTLVTVDCTDTPSTFFAAGDGWQLYSIDGERRYRTPFVDVRVRARAGV